MRGTRPALVSGMNKQYDIAIIYKASTMQVFVSLDDMIGYCYEMQDLYQTEAEKLAIGSIILNMREMRDRRREKYLKEKTEEKSKGFFSRLFDW